MKEQIPQQLNIICPYCNAPFTANMMTELSSSSGCDTCGYGSDPSGNIDIYCNGCKKLIYRKEI